MPEVPESTLPNWLLSSTGEGISLRVKSFLVGILPTVLVIATLLGHPVGQEDANAWVSIIVNVLEAAIALIAICFHAIGWIRARYYKKHDMGKFAP
jgi:hypothetical protein